MEIGVTFFVIAIAVVLIWVLIELKRFKHKIFAIFLIGALLFFYFSVSHTLKSNEIEISSVSGITEAGKIYMAWLGNVFGNVKSITSNAINMNWGSNETNP